MAGAVQRNVFWTASASCIEYAASLSGRVDGVPSASKLKELFVLPKKPAIDQRIVDQRMLLGDRLSGPMPISLEARVGAIRRGQRCFRRGSFRNQEIGFSPQSGIHHQRDLCNRGVRELQADQ